MNVLHVVAYYWPAIEWGGPAHSVPLLAAATRRAGVGVAVVTTSTRGSRGLLRVRPGVRTVNGVDVAYCRSYGPSRYFFSYSLLAHLFRGIPRADLVHIHGVWTFPVLAAARVCGLLGIPYILSARGTLTGWALAHRSSKKRAYLRLLGLHTLQGAELVHYTTECERDAVMPSLRGLPSIVLPNPVELSYLLDVQPPAREAGRLRILVVGRIHRVKGFDILIPAIADAARRHEVTLTVAGPDEGGYRNEVERMVRANGVASIVRFTGNLAEEALVNEFTKADAVVMPSYQENFGMAAAEAMAAGRPVVVSEAVGLAPDIAAARAGVVVPLDSRSLAEAILTLAADPDKRIRMGERGRQLTRDRYAPDAVARAMIDVYKDVIHNHKRRPLHQRLVGM